MPAGHHPDRGSRRGFDHAHRIRQPVGSVDGRRPPTLRPGPRVAGPGLGSILAVVVVALLAIVVRPWDGLLGAPGGAGGPGPGATDRVTTATARPATAGEPSAGPASIGPHGDGVTGPDASSAAPKPSGQPVTGPDDPDAGPDLTGYQWPLRNARITNGFGAGRPSSFLLDGQSFHDGIDIASFCGAKILAAHDGVVLGAGRRTAGLLGWVGDLTAFRAKLDAEDAWRTQAITVVIDDGNSYRSIYAHLGVATVEKGDVVQAGDQIGWEGASGNATGCHLHYALFDPLETDTLKLDPKIAKKTKLPGAEIARIDPLPLLPPPETAGITWGWGAR